MNLREGPVCVSSNDGGDELCNTESTHQGVGRSLHEEEAMRTGDEDEHLRDDGDLEVDDHVQLRVVRLGTRDALRARDGDAELVVEEVRLDDNRAERNPTRMSAQIITTLRWNTYVEAVR